MLITVCIINHDYAGFVGLAVESALAQDHGETQVVVVDDGSTDRSLEVLEGYRDRVTIVGKCNGGQASAINAGFAEARGEVVLFLDADDVLLPGVLRQVHERFAADSETVKVALRMQKIDADGEPIDAFEPARDWPLPRGNLRDHVLRRRSYVWPASSGNAYRRRALGQVLPMPEEPFRVEADLYLATLVPLLGPIDAIDEPLVGYRIHGANAYAGSSPDGAFFRRKLKRIEFVHGVVEDWLARTGQPRPERVDLVADPAYLSYRIASAVLDPAAHPHPNDPWRRFAIRGAVLAARHPGHPARARARRSVWFAALALAPRRRAAGLVGLRFSRPQSLLGAGAA